MTPATLLAGPVPRLIDEWQLAPSIWNSIWAEIDCPAWHGLVTAVAINALRDDMDSLADVDLRSLPCRGFD